MIELLPTLPRGSRILDLGCAAGSFRVDTGDFTIFRADLETIDPSLPNLVRADAARLPFPDRSFHLIVCNHSLEHFENLPASLAEIARVAHPDGAICITVPDATTFCDRLYRWLAQGGGHVNAFRSARELSEQIEQVTGLKHVGTRTLCTSLSFLNRRNARQATPRRLWLLGNGSESALRVISYLSRLSDRLMRTRLSMYGWAFYFGRLKAPSDRYAWINVCIRCGSGCPSAWLESQPHAVQRRRFLRTYVCPQCGASNPFAPDGAYPQFWNNDGG